RINPAYFCGGEIEADMDGARRALGVVAERLGTGVDEAARGIVRIANNDMVNALKLVSVNRGYDPRDFTLVAFGGGGGMHAVALAQELGMKRVVVPRGASVSSAWGMMMSDLRRDFFVTRLIEEGEGMVAALAALIDETRKQALDRFAHEKISREKVTLVAHVKCRYQNQEHAVEVLFPGDAVNAASVAEMLDRFHAVYEREYTYRLTAPVEIV